MATGSSRWLRTIGASLTETRRYGDGDATCLACGGKAGIRRLVNAFYDLMASEAKFANLRDMHPKVSGDFPR